MKPARRRWKAPAAGKTGSPRELVEAILTMRGYLAAQSLDALRSAGRFHDPFLLPDMGKAVDLIGDALHRGRPIVIYGDYDSDGVTATALMVRSLSRVSSAVQPYIPHRQTEGYGLNAQALEELSAKGEQLVITVDCGTTSTEIVANRPPGMSMIITDHHLPPALPDGIPSPLPPADALINPKLADSAYPFDGLAGVGVAWKLVQALEEKGMLPEGTAMAEIGLAAIGTIADIMPLLGENRLIVSTGLAQLSAGSHRGIYALMTESRVDLPLTSQDVAFSLGPRINAAGRMEHALAALELCLTDDADIAAQRSAHLNMVNAERRAALSAAMKDAELKVAELPEEERVIVLGSSQWHMGIVGLIAGRLAERYARPAFIASLDGSEAKGSARSVASIHILPILKSGAEYLTKYGGHTGAAGFSFPADKFESLRDALVAGAVSLDLPADPERIFEVDGELTGTLVSLDTVRELEKLEPFGCGNPVPAFGIFGCDVLGVRQFGKERAHVGVTVRTEDGVGVEAIAFGKPDLAQHLPRGRKVDLLATLEANTFRGTESPQLLIRDIQPSREGAAASRPGTGQ